MQQWTLGGDALVIEIHRPVPVVLLPLLQSLQLGRESAVGSQDDIVLKEIVCRCLFAVVDEGGESVRGLDLTPDLLLPLSQQREGGNNQVGLSLVSTGGSSEIDGTVATHLRTSSGLSGEHKRYDGYGFSKAHVIRENAALVCPLLHLLQPRQCELLMSVQGPLKTLRSSIAVLLGYVKVWANVLKEIIQLLIRHSRVVHDIVDIVGDARRKLVAVFIGAIDVVIAASTLDNGG